VSVNDDRITAANPRPRQPWQYRPSPDPAPLGLAAFALTTFLLSAANAGWMTKATGASWLGYAFAYGGVVQLLAAMWEFRNKNVFGPPSISGATAASGSASGSGSFSCSGRHPRPRAQAGLRGGEHKGPGLDPAGVGHLQHLHAADQHPDQHCHLLDVAPPERPPRSSCSSPSSRAVGNAQGRRLRRRRHRALRLVHLGSGVTNGLPAGSACGWPPADRLALLIGSPADRLAPYSVGPLLHQTGPETSCSGPGRSYGPRLTALPPLPHRYRRRDGFAPCGREGGTKGVGIGNDEQRHPDLHELSTQVALVKERTRPWKETIALVLAIAAAEVRTTRCTSSCRM